MLSCITTPSAISKRSASEESDAGSGTGALGAFGLSSRTAFTTAGTGCGLGLVGGLDGAGSTGRTETAVPAVSVVLVAAGLRRTNCAKANTANPTMTSIHRAPLDVMVCAPVTTAATAALTSDGSEKRPITEDQYPDAPDKMFGPAGSVDADLEMGHAEQPNRVMGLSRPSSPMSASGTRNILHTWRSTDGLERTGGVIARSPSQRFGWSR